MALMNVTHPDGSTSQVEMNEAIVLHGVDVDGNYLGLVAPNVAYKQVDPPPELGTWKWNFGTSSWVRHYTLQQLKDARWGLMKIARDQMEQGGFVWDGSTFDSDTVSQSRIQGASQLATLAALASQPFEVPWTLADNTVRVLTGAEMLSTGEAMGIHIMTAHAIGRSLRDVIESATTPEEIEAVSWPT
jgi:hypothetical protein